MFGKGKRYRQPKQRTLIKFVVKMNGLYWRQNGMGGRWTNKIAYAEYFQDLGSAIRIARATHGWVYTMNSLTGRVRPCKI